MKLMLSKVKASAIYRLETFLLKFIEQFHQKCDALSIADNIIITANPRGGSTWLADLFSKIPKTYTLYEPLNKAYMPELKALQFSRRQYIPEDADWPEAYYFFDRLLRGNILHHRLALHPMSRNKSALQVLKGKTQVLKFCRLNLMLPWLVKNFNLRPPVLLLRHPCAVVYSQMEFARKYGGEWAATTFIDQHQTGPYADFLKKFKHITDKINTQQEQLAALWCVTNKIPLCHPYNNVKWITVSYEELLLKTAPTLSGISNRLNVNFNNALYAASMQASGTSLQDRKSIPTDEQINRWKGKLSTRQISLIMDIVKRFEMDQFYDYDAEPNYKNLKSNQQKLI